MPFPIDPPTFVEFTDAEDPKAGKSFGSSAASLAPDVGTPLTPGVVRPVADPFWLARWGGSGELLCCGRDDGCCE